MRRSRPTRHRRWIGCTLVWALTAATSMAAATEAAPAGGPTGAAAMPAVDRSAPGTVRRSIVPDAELVERVRSVIGDEQLLRDTLAAERNRDVIRHLDCFEPAEVDALFEAGLTREIRRVSSTAWLSAAALVVLALLAAGALVKRRRMDSSRPPERAPPASAGATDVVEAWALAAIACGWLVFQVFLLARTGRLPLTDAEIFASAVFNGGSGRGLFSAYEGLDHLGVHASPVLYLFAWLWRLAPHPLTLPVVNAVVVGSTAAPAWLLARRHLTRPWAVPAVVALVVTPSFASLGTDFHPVGVALPLLTWALWALDVDRPLTLVGTVVAAMACKENVPLVVAAIGLVVASDRERRWTGGTLVALGAAGFAVSIGTVIPAHLGDMGGTTADYEHLGGVAGSLVSPFTRPAALGSQLGAAGGAQYLVVVLAMFGLVPLLAPRQLLVAAPALAQNALSSKSTMRALLHHYEALALPGLLLATVVGLARIRDLRGRAVAVAAIVVGSAVVNLDVGRSWPDDLRTVTAEAAADIASHVPADVSVIAPREVAWRVPHRTVLLRATPWFVGTLPVMPAYVVLPVDESGAPTAEWAETFRTLLDGHYEAAYANSEFGLWFDARPAADRCRSDSLEDGGGAEASGRTDPE